MTNTLSETARSLSKAQDWRLPYRSMDASGSPETASAVAWEWINGLAKASPDGTGYIESTRVGADGHAIILYYGTQPYAVATIFRDTMNFAVLVRWKSPVERSALRTHILTEEQQP